MNKKALLLIIPFAAAGLAGCERANPNPPGPTPDPQCESATVNIKSAGDVTTIKPGQTLQLTAEVNISGCTFSWSSNDPTIATVDENGKVTAVKEGNVTIVYGSGSFNLIVDNETPTPPPTPVDDYGTEDRPLSVTQAVAVIQAECPEDTNLTKQVIYCTGVVKEITKSGVYDPGDNYFQLVCTDNTTDIIVYRVHATDELKDNVQVGSQIKWVGYAKNFKGTLEFVDNGETPCTLLKNGDAPVSPSLILSKTKENVKVGADVTINATVKNTENSVQWSLVGDSGSFVSITPNGNSVTIHGVAKGFAKVKAAIPADNLEALCEIEVKEDVSPASVNVEYSFDKLTRDDNNEYDGDEALAAFNAGKTLGDAIVTAVTPSKTYPGEGSLRVGSSSNGGSIEITTSANVTQVVVTARAYIKSDKPELNTISIGSQTETVEEASNEFVYDVSATKSVTISTSKRVLIEKIGFVAEGTTPVTPSVEKVELNKSKLNLQPAGSEKLTASVEVVGGAAQTVNWSSDNEDVATVDDDGTVHAVAVGTAHITATSTEDTSKSASCTVSVTSEPVVICSSIKVSQLPTKNVYDVGETFNSAGVVIKAVYSNSSEVDVTSSCTFTPTTPLAKDSVVKAHYTEDGQNFECAINVTINSPTPTPTGEITVNTEYELTCSSLSLEKKYTSNDKGDIGWVDLYGSDSPVSIQGNKRAVSDTRPELNSELWNINPFSKEIKTVEFVAAKDTGDATLSIFFGTATKPNGNKVDIGKGTSYTFTKDVATIVEAPAGCKYFDITWTKYASNFASIKFTFAEAPAPVTLQSITASGIKTNYEVGDQLDLTGLKVMGHYSDNTDKEITEGYTTSLLDGHTLALTDEKVVVTFEGKTADIALTITDPSAVLDSISIEGVANKYYVGGTLGSVTVIAHYSNDTTTDVTSLAELKIGEAAVGSDHVMALTDTQLDASYEGKTASVTLNVVEDSIVSIAVSNDHRSFTLNAAFVKETVTATYESGKTADVTEGASFTGYDMASEGKQTVTVAYTGATSITYEITVSAEPEYKNFDVALTGYADSTASGYVNKNTSATFENVSFMAYGYMANNGQVRGNKTVVGTSSTTTDTCNFHIYNTSALPKAYDTITMSASNGSFKGHLFIAYSNDAPLGDHVDPTASNVVVASYDTETSKTATFDMTLVGPYKYVKIFTNENFTNSTVSGVSISFAHNNNPTPASISNVTGPDKVDQNSQIKLSEITMDVKMSNDETLTAVNPTKVVADTSNLGSITVTVYYGQVSSTFTTTVVEATGLVTTGISLPSSGTGSFYSGNKVVFPEDSTEYDAIRVGKKDGGATCTISVAKGETQLIIYGVGWNGKTANLTVSYGASYSQEITITSNAGASGNSPYSITVDPSTCVYVFEFGEALTENTTVTLSTNLSVIIWSIQSAH